MTAPSGTYIAYATSPGSVAADGSGEHGTFTQAVLDNLAVPGAKIEDVFKSVGRAVHTASSGKQLPWTSSSLMTDFYFVPTAE